SAGNLRRSLANRKPALPLFLGVGEGAVGGGGAGNSDLGLCRLARERLKLRIGHLAAKGLPRDFEDGVVAVAEAQGVAGEAGGAEQDAQPFAVPGGRAGEEIVAVQ